MTTTTRADNNASTVGPETVMPQGQCFKRGPDVKPVRILIVSALGCGRSQAWSQSASQIMSWIEKCRPGATDNDTSNVRG